MTENETQPKEPKEGFAEIYTKKAAREQAANIGPAPVVVVEKQVNAPKRVYDVPVELGIDDDPETAIQQFKSAVSADFKGHPYVCKTHPLHKNYVKHFAYLHEQHAAQKADEYFPAPLEVFEEKQAQKEAKAQAIRCQLAEIEMKKLGKLDFNVAEIPPDITETKYQLLKAERLYAEQNFLEGDSIAREVGRQLKISSSTLQAYFNLRNCSESPDAKKTVANQICFYLNDEHKNNARNLKS